MILVISIGDKCLAYPGAPTVKITAESSFIDSKGRLNVVGTVRNTGDTPLHVIMGLNAQDANGTRTLQQPTYGRIVWPLNDSPFKFVIDSGVLNNNNKPFILDIQEAKDPNYLMLVLNYSSMAAGTEKAFVGTIRNTAPFDVHNVSIFASVRGSNATQLDTVRSNIIPLLKAGEVLTFVAIPDPAVKSKVYYYSCAGIDLDAPITTIDAGSGRTIPYDLRAVAQISSLHYENSTDSIDFGVTPYQPDGGPVSIQFPQFNENQRLTIMLDGKPYGNAAVKGDGKTMHIDFFVPKGDHQIQIMGIRNVPEFPLTTLALTTITLGIVLALIRFKTVFKVP
jgi:hypothetical protein